nr:CHAD domain-containing protein [Phycisphaerales bacterium]
MATTTGMADTGLLLARAGGPIAHDLAKRLTRVAREKVSARDVHRLRSGSRRLAALFHHLPGPGGSARRRRVRSMIRLLRRRAGKVRDCDVSLEIVERELP